MKKQQTMSAIDRISVIKPNPANKLTTMEQWKERVEYNNWARGRSLPNAR